MQVSLAAVNQICVFHEAMDGCKNLKFIKGLLQKCKYCKIISDKAYETCAFYPLHKAGNHNLHEAGDQNLHKAGDQNLHKSGDQYDTETTKRIEVAYEFTYCTKPVEEKKEAR